MARRASTWGLRTAVTVVTLAAIGVVYGAVMGGWSLTIAACAAVLAGAVAVVLMERLVVSARRLAGADRVGLARQYAQLADQRTAENSALLQTLTQRITARDATIAERDGLLRVREQELMIREQELIARSRELAVATELAHEHAQVAATAQEVVRETRLRLHELEAELDAVNAELGLLRSQQAARWGRLQRPAN